MFNIVRSRRSGRFALFATFTVFASVVVLCSKSYADTSRLVMPNLNSDYFPGIVLYYDDDDLRPATREDVEPDANYYVLIHGAKEGAFDTPLRKLAPTILKTDSKAQVFFVDWGYWSRGIFSDHLIKQTEYIPRVAKRAYGILFDSDICQYTFYTGDMDSSRHTWFGKLFSSDVESKVDALGLDPGRTHIIGRSHGAHVGGLICKYVAENSGDVELLSPTVKRLSALDPSTKGWHWDNETSNWDSSVAGLVDVYRLSAFCCDDHIYGDFNVSCFDLAKHPEVEEAWEKAVNNMGDPEEGFWKTLAKYGKDDKILHGLAVDFFIKNCEDKEFLKAKSFSDLWDDPSKEGKWIILEE